MNSKEATKPASAFNDTGGNFCSLCSAWKGSLGLEPTPELYIKHLCDIFDEVKRVLKKTGSIWVNLGDSYSGSNCGSNDYRGMGASISANPEKYKGQKPKGSSASAKSLVGIPEMFVLEMQGRGWIRRNTIIWYKPNPMPSSAQDRFTVDFEYIYLFTKSNDAQFWTNEKTLQLVSKPPAGTQGIEGQDWEWRVCPNCKKDILGTSPDGKIVYHKSPVGIEICKRCKGTGQIKHSFWSGHDCFFERQFEKILDLERPKYAYKIGKSKEYPEVAGCCPDSESRMIPSNPQGRNKRCVWRIPTQNFSDAHFATFPEKLVESCLLPGCPEFVCSKCGQPRMKIYRDTGNLIHQGGYGSKTAEHIGVSPTSSLLTKAVKEREEIGYTDCGCGEKFEGGVCLDPFMGSGTVGVVALKLRRKFIGIEIKPEYCKMAEARIKPLLAQKRLI